VALSGWALAACGGEGDAALPGQGGGGSSSVGGGAGGGAGAAGQEAGGAGGAGGEAFCGTDGVSKGPWVVGATDTTARVRWESCISGRNQVAFTPAAGGAELTAMAVETATEITSEYKSILTGVPRDLAGTWLMHEATLEGLSAGTCYAYSVAGSGADKGRFCTARASGEGLTFIAVGDTNPGLGDSSAKVLDALLPSNPDFTLHQGDMQYYASGLETYASWFPVMAPMLQQGAILPAVGNHESEKPDEFVSYFTRFFGGAGEDAGTGKSYFRFTSAGLHFFSLDTEQSIKAGSEQATWLLAALADARKQPGFVGSVVYMHRPLATCGDAGHLDQERAELEPAFQAEGVKLVLAGHMHGYERFELGGLTYVVTGGGGGAIGKIDDNIDRPECASRVAKAQAFHGVVFRAEGGKLQGKAVDLTGKELDAFSIDLQ
jgi:acid phosphatase type 7